MRLPPAQLVSKKADIKISISDEKKLSIIWNYNEHDKIDVLELIQKTNFTHLKFNFQDYKLFTITQWLKDSGFENFKTQKTLFEHMKSVGESYISEEEYFINPLDIEPTSIEDQLDCLHQFLPKPIKRSYLTVCEYFMILLDTKFTPTEDKTFPFCTMINRAIMAQDQENLQKLIKLLENCKDNETAKHSMISLLLTATGLIASALSKLAEKNISHHPTFRYTFLDDPSLTLLITSYATGEPVIFPQLLSSSKIDRSSMTEIQLNNPTGALGKLVFLNPLGGDISGISYFPNELEVLVLPTHFIVHEASYDEDNKMFIFYLRSTWSPEKSPKKTQTINPSNTMMGLFSNSAQREEKKDDTDTEEFIPNAPIKNA